MSMRFAHKLLFSVVAFMSVSIGIILYLAITHEKSLISSIQRDNLRLVNSIIFDELYTSMRYGGGRKENRAIIKRLNSIEGIEEVRVIHGEPVERQFGVEEDEVPRDELEKIAIQGKEVMEEYTENGVRKVRFIMPLFVKEECLRCHRAKVGEVNGAISLTVSLDKYDAMVHEAIKRFIITSLILVGIVVLAAIAFILHYNVRPLAELYKAAKIIGSGNLDYRIDIKDGMEINRLVEEFNNMAQRLKERTDELIDLNRKLEAMSITDGLTGLYNHRYFYKRFAEELERAKRYDRRLSLVMADIDNFKHYNDTHGHQKGDVVLKGVAECIKNTLRVNDVPARYGGEEFAIILPETAKDTAVKVAERIRMEVEKKDFQGEEKQPGGSLTISIGVATFPDDGTTVDELVKKADEALYRAKRKGRNRVEAV